MCLKKKKKKNKEYVQNGSFCSDVQNIYIRCNVIQSVLLLGVIFTETNYVQEVQLSYQMCFKVYETRKHCSVCNIYTGF